MSFIAKPIQNLVQWATTPQKKRVYHLSEGSLADQRILTPKFASLCELWRLGVPTPPSVIITSEAAAEYHENGDILQESLVLEYTHHIREMERLTDKVYGSKSGAFPLLLCLRVGVPSIQHQVSSSAEVSMAENWGRMTDESGTSFDIFGILGLPDSWCCPGVMESVVALGMNDEIVKHLINITDRRFALHTYARFLFQFGCTILGAAAKDYYDVLNEVSCNSLSQGGSLTSDNLAYIIQEFKKIQSVPDDPWEQLKVAVGEAYDAWFDTKNIMLREEALSLPSSGIYPALCLQAMVFGGLGVCFTRCPLSGTKGLYGDYWLTSGGKTSLTDLFRLYDGKEPEVKGIATILESHFRDMQDIEFIVEDTGVLYVIQTRPGRRTPKASMKIAVDMVHEGIVTEREALLRIDPYKCSYFVEEQIAANEGDSGVPESDAGDALSALGGAKSVPKPTSDSMRICVTGLAASQGVISGVLALDAEECARLSMNQQDVIFCVCESTCSLTDYAACRSAAGVLCIGGTLVSDIAMICRNLGKPCVVAVGATPIRLEGTTSKDPVKLPARLLYGSGDTLCAGDHVTLDGSCGKLYLGRPSLTVHKKDPNFLIILKWADKYRRLRVNTTIKTGLIADEMRMACDLGTDGFGCISTDPLFCFTGDRLSLTRLALFSQSEQERNRHIAVLCELHREDFKSIFRASEGKPVCIKLLDTSLNYLLPSSERFAAELATSMNTSVSDVKRAMAAVHDSNPDIGLRGCRISAVFPFITEMQIRAVLTALLDLLQSDSPPLVGPLRIAIPMLSSDHEITSTVNLIRQAAKKVLDERGAGDLEEILYSIGVILNSPRACMRAGSIAARVEFLNINIEDLTMMMFGTSDADSEKFMPLYLKDSVYHSNPFRTLDQKGVGAMMQAAIKASRNKCPLVQCGVTEGLQTGDPRSLTFINDLGFDHVSCRPKDIPIARIVAAQAHIRSTLAAVTHDPAFSASSVQNLPYGSKTDQLSSRFANLGEDSGNMLIDEAGNTVVLV